MVKLKFKGFRSINDYQWQNFKFKSINIEDLKREEVKEVVQNKLNEWLKNNGCRKGHYELITEDYIN